MPGAFDLFGPERKHSFLFDSQAVWPARGRVVVCICRAAACMLKLATHTTRLSKCTTKIGDEQGPLMSF